MPEEKEGDELAKLSLCAGQQAVSCVFCGYVLGGGLISGTNQKALEANRPDDQGRATQGHSLGSSRGLTAVAGWEFPEAPLPWLKIVVPSEGLAVEVAS